MEITIKQYEKVVFELGELAHSERELLEECSAQMVLLAKVQDIMGIDEHEIRRSNFRVVDEALNMGDGSYKP